MVVMIDSSNDGVNYTLSAIFDKSAQLSRSRFGHNVRRPTQFDSPNSDTICPNGNLIGPNKDKIYLTLVTFIFLLLFNEKRDSSFPSGLWIALFWLPAETLSLKRLPVMKETGFCQVIFRTSRRKAPTSPHFHPRWRRSLGLTRCT